MSDDEGDDDEESEDEEAMSDGAALKARRLAGQAAKGSAAVPQQVHAAPIHQGINTALCRAFTSPTPLQAFCTNNGMCLSGDPAQSSCSEVCRTRDSLSGPCSHTADVIAAGGQAVSRGGAVQSAHRPSATQAGKEGTAAARKPGHAEGCRGGV